MSDFTTDPGYDPYALDPDTANLIMMLSQSGYQPYPQNMNVPYVKDLMGGSTDPLRQIKSQQSDLKSARSLMGYDPIAGFAGPEFDPYVPQYDSVAQEATGDPYAEALLQDLQNGQGALSLATQIDNATYKDADGPDQANGKVLSASQAKNYKSWLERAQKAYTADTLEFAKRDQMATQGDPNAMVPTPESQNFNEDDYIKQIAASGDLGPQNQSYARRGSTFSQRPSFTGPADVAPPSGPMGRIADLMTRVGGGGSSKVPQRTNVSPVARAEAAGYKAREQGYRGRAQQAVKTAVQPSAARERAVRAIQAYRLAMGMSPN